MVCQNSITQRAILIFQISAVRETQAQHFQLSRGALRWTYVCYKTLSVVQRFECFLFDFATKLRSADLVLDKDLDAINCVNPPTTSWFYSLAKSYAKGLVFYYLCIASANENL